MYTISKEFHFSASHQLEMLPPEHQCARLHGHNYILTVELSGGQLNPVGFVMDYGELAFVKEMVDELDHQHLNEMFGFNPTSENICKYFFLQVEEELKSSQPGVEFLGIGLSETPKTNAWYRRWL